MKERPILFSGEMVCAILEGRKTQTRRVVKVPRWALAGQMECDGCEPNWPMAEDCYGDRQKIDCPYGQPGDRLWVRETFCEFDPNKHGILGIHEKYAYRAETTPEGEEIRKGYGYSWRPSIFMPRWASRITLEVTAVRVERVQDISPEDALAEGDVEALTNPRHKETSIDWYHNLWDSINGAGSWASNPWVWVVEFRRIAQ
jgi:hypothetical protein